MDLGSNSFRLEISNLHGEDHFLRVEYLKETVRQGAGLDAEGNLSREAMERGWQCLARFGERLRNFPPTHVRALATQTLREARNRQEFLTQGAKLLGHPIEVISGAEEARLIYQGVTYFLPLAPEEHRMVIDIGGRSSEVIAGMGQTGLAAASFPIGSVSWSQRFFGDGKVSAKAFNKAEIAAHAVLEERLPLFDAYPKELVYGSSGTMNAVAQILHQMGLCEPKTITIKALAALKSKVLEFQQVDKIDLPGLRDDRRPVICGGISVLTALMQALGVASLKISDGALRQGAMVDLIMRDKPPSAHCDIREKTVDSLLQRFGYDSAQGTRVADTATQIWRAWALPHASAEDLQELQWAAMLHEIGISIAYERYNHHGAYILENADCPGFLPSERQNIARLIRGHKGKLKKVQEWLLAEHGCFTQQLLCLRLALVLCHARKAPVMQALRWSTPKPRSAKISISPNWVQMYPQSYYLLQEEATQWEKVGYELRLVITE